MNQAVRLSEIDDSFPNISKSQQNPVPAQRSLQLGAQMDAYSA
jgi:hypothetical protein